MASIAPLQSGGVCRMVPASTTGRLPGRSPRGANMAPPGRATPEKLIGAVEWDALLRGPFDPCSWRFGNAKWGRGRRNHAHPPATRRRRPHRSRRIDAARLRRAAPALRIASHREERAQSCPGLTFRAYGGRTRNGVHFTIVHHQPGKNGQFRAIALPEVTAICYTQRNSPFTSDRAFVDVTPKKLVPKGGLEPPCG